MNDSKITDAMATAALSANFTDYRSDYPDTSMTTLRDLLHASGAHHSVDEDEMMKAILFAASPPTFQFGVTEWMHQCFPQTVITDVQERGDRFLEETLELLQANGYDCSRVATLVDYVWGRPVGVPAQEVGGVMVTLAAYCSTLKLDMHEEGDRELARITQTEVMEKIRRKQDAKNAIHFDSPLPGNPDAVGGGDAAGVIASVDLRFRSGNSIPVNCARITIEEWEQVKHQLAARQPVAQVVGYMDPEADFMLPRAGDCMLMSKVEVCLLRDPHGKWTKPLYDAPPAPAAAVPVDANPLSAYAESYRMMARIGDGKVDCLSVASDIENNMMRHATHPQPAADGDA